MNKEKRNKFLNLLADLGKTWAMASDPAVMQASGYKSTPEGVKYEDSDGAKRLRENLAVLSGTANTLTNIGLSGLGPALASEAGAVVGGIAGNKIGEKIDERVGTTYWAPVLGFTGAMIGGSAPYTASRYWNGLKTAWNSGKTIRPEYSNWGGEFIMDVPRTQKYRTTIGPEDSFLHQNVSRSQRELWAAQSTYHAALKTGDKKLIGETADALNRQHKKYLTETGLAKVTDLELVTAFNDLRAIASHNRQVGGDYLTYTRQAMKLVPEMNRRGLTKSYYPTHDDLTYTLVTDSERFRYLADKFGSQAMKDAAANSISAYDSNIAQARKYRKLADETIGGYTRPMEIGRRTYSPTDPLPKKSLNATMKEVEKAINNGAVDIYTFMNSDIYKNSTLHDIALAKRAFGYDITPVMNGNYVLTGVKVQNKPMYDALGMTAMDFTNNPSRDVIYIDVNQHPSLQALENTAFHEYGHHGRYKAVDPIKHFLNGAPGADNDVTTKFYQWKLKHLFKPEVEIPAHLVDHYNYLVKNPIAFNEGATNVLEIGRAGGFNQAAGYPGAIRLREMLDDVLLANPDYQYTIDLLDMKHPKRVWNALIGNYEEGGTLTDDEYVEKIKGFFKWRTMSPKEHSHVYNFKA